MTKVWEGRSFEKPKIDMTSLMYNPSLLYLMMKLLSPSCYSCLWFKTTLQLFSVERTNTFMQLTPPG